MGKFRIHLIINAANGDASKDFELPFPPYVGLEIDFAADPENEELREIRITNCHYELATNRFICFATTETDDLEERPSIDKAEWIAVGFTA